MTVLYDFYRLYAAEIALTTAGVALLLLLWVIALQWRLASLQRRYRAAMGGTDGSDMEASLARLHAAQQDHTERIRALESHGRTLGERVAAQAGHVGMVRFNPFQDSGGDQSFAVAWVDDQTNGIVVSSLYSRAGVRVYAKPLERGSSTYTLTDEEHAAIKLAQARQPATRA